MTHLLDSHQDFYTTVPDVYGDSYENVAGTPEDEKKTADEELLNGPQNTKEAASQDEIDAILNGF